VVGVLLTGGGDDGVDGLIAIKVAGGISIVQDPAEATHPWMPWNAIVHDHVDLVLPLAGIPAALGLLAAGEPVVAGWAQASRASR
jgi:two-component system chemotaxis response regulator CheB